MSETAQDSVINAYEKDYKTRSVLPGQGDPRVVMAGTHPVGKSQFNRDVIVPPSTREREEKDRGKINRHFFPPPLPDATRVGNS